MANYYTQEQINTICNTYTARTGRRCKPDGAQTRVYADRAADAGFTPEQVINFINARGDSLTTLYQALTARKLKAFYDGADGGADKGGAGIPAGGKDEDQPAGQAEQHEDSEQREAEQAGIGAEQQEQDEAGQDAGTPWEQPADAEQAGKEQDEAHEEQEQPAQDAGQQEQAEQEQAQTLTAEQQATLDAFLDAMGGRKKPAPPKGDEIRHKAFDAVMFNVVNDRDLLKTPWLYGEAGTGKSKLCEQVADALNLPFYYVNGITDEYQLTGYQDAHGRFVKTQFYDAFKNGGLFMVDEIDSSNPTALIKLNEALANYRFPFANGETVTASPDFHAIAAGNTTGGGASTDYSGRLEIDEASLDRFFFHHIDYDARIEERLTQDSELLDFCRAYRAAGDKAGMSTICSYRSIKALDLFARELGVKQALQGTLFARKEQDDLRMLLPYLPENNKYTKAVSALAA